VIAPSFLLDACPDLVSHHSSDGAFLYASSKAIDVFGQSPDLLLGTSLLDLACESDRADTRAAWNALPRSGAIQKFRFRASCQGKLRRLEINARYLVEGDGAGTIVCITRNVDELFAVEQDAVHWKELVAQVPGIVWHAPIRPDGTRAPAEFISDYLERVVGYTPHQWLTTPNFWASIIHPEDLERTMEAIARYLTDGTPAPPYRVRSKDGKTIYFQSYLRVLRNREGVAERMYGLTLDVTAFKEVEATNAALLEQVIALSAPIIPVRDDVIVVPLLGVLDKARAERLLGSLLESISQRKTTVAIVDLTGISAVDETGAEGLVRAARAAQLLGASVILTGLSADVARCMIELGLSLQGLPTRATLARALEELRRTK
jgi:rsbT co-antagonist protein RsbR